MYFWIWETREEQLFYLLATLNKKLSIVVIAGTPSLSIRNHLKMATNYSPPCPPAPVSNDTSPVIPVATFYTQVGYGSFVIGKLLTGLPQPGKLFSFQSVISSVSIVYDSI
jgi:hypothetical protein